MLIYVQCCIDSNTWIFRKLSQNAVNYKHHCYEHSWTCLLGFIWQFAQDIVGSGITELSYTHIFNLVIANLTSQDNKYQYFRTCAGTSYTCAHAHTYMTLQNRETNKSNSCFRMGCRGLFSALIDQYSTGGHSGFSFFILFQATLCINTQILVHVQIVSARSTWDFTKEKRLSPGKLG